MKKHAERVDFHHEWVRIAKIGAPHGVRGEVKAVSLSDVPGRFESIRNVIWLGGDNQNRRLTVVSCKPCDRFIILSFAEVAGRDEAMRLTNGFLAIPASERGKLPEGKFFIDDILGITVEDEKGAILGKVSSIYHTGSNDVYEIQGEGNQEWLVPARRDSVLKIDLELQKMVVKIPEGYSA